MPSALCTENTTPSRTSSSFNTWAQWAGNLVDRQTWAKSPAAGGQLGFLGLFAFVRHLLQLLSVCSYCHRLSHAPNSQLSSLKGTLALLTGTAVRCPQHSNHAHSRSRIWCLKKHKQAANKYINKQIRGSRCTDSVPDPAAVLVRAAWTHRGEYELRS